MTATLTRRLRIFAIVLAVLLVSYTVFGFWIVPRLVRGQLESFSQQHWQRAPTVGEIAFNPFRLALRIHDFEFVDSTAAPLLSFDRLLVNVDLASLWRRGPSFHVIELDRPDGRLIIRSDGSVNLAELTAPFAGSGPAPQSDPEPARLFIDCFRLSGGILEFEDHARTAPFKARLAPVNFELLDFATTGDGSNHYSLQATSSAGESFRWSGNFGLTPLQSRGSFELSDVRAHTLWSYLQEALGFEVTDGLVALQGEYDFAASEPKPRIDIRLPHLTIAGLKVRARAGNEDWVQLDRIELGEVRAATAQRTLDVGSLQFSGGQVLARRDAGGSVNLLTLFSAPASTQPNEQPKPEQSDNAPGWTVNAPSVRISGLQVTIEDQFVSPAARLSLSPMDVELKGFGTAPGQTMTVDASFVLEQGGKARVQGTGVPAESNYSARLTLDDLKLAALQPYIGTYTQMTLLSGTLSANLDTEWQSDRFILAGDLRSDGLHTVDNALREDFVKWDRLAISDFEYRSRPESLRIGTIAARAPYVRLVIAPDQTTNVAKVLTVPANAPGPVQTVRGAAQKPSGARGPSIQIGRIQVENGSANFADFWITPNYAVSLQQLGGNVSGLSSRKDSRASVNLTGRIDRYAPAEITGELNLLSASLFTDLRVKFDGVELTSVTPYSGRFAGYRIEKGKLSVNVRYQVANRQLQAEQRFIVDQLTLGERVDSPDAVKLPLRLAVALLKDRNGVIDLGLPVSGSLDDPKFRVGPIVWKAFVNLLTGIATSPFKLLGGVFGGGEEVNLIEFAPGSAALDALATERLASLTRALRERPQLALEVPATWSPDADADVLVASQLEARLTALAQARKETEGAVNDPAHRVDLLLALYRTERKEAALPPGALAVESVRARERDAADIAAAIRELESALRPAPDALQPQLELLAQQRARAIQDALLASGEVEPGRVFMVASAAQPATDGKVRVALGLK